LKIKPDIQGKINVYSIKTIKEQKYLHSTLPGRRERGWGELKAVQNLQSQFLVLERPLILLNEGVNDFLHGIVRDELIH
jgi:hypothetical protein